MGIISVKQVVLWLSIASNTKIEQPAILNFLKLNPPIE
jgi:hypothetical protein